MLAPTREVYNTQSALVVSSLRLSLQREGNLDTPKQPSYTRLTNRSRYRGPRICSVWSLFAAGDQQYPCALDRCRPDNASVRNWCQTAMQLPDSLRRFDGMCQNCDCWYV